MFTGVLCDGDKIDFILQEVWGKFLFVLCNFLVGTLPMLWSYLTLVVKIADQGAKLMANFCQKFLIQNGPEASRLRKR